jgi:chromosome segregation protein
MRLRKIKLVGFKSFVDPTTLVVPGNLVGIVGPNGCGKSNIIDAVTWVMGESSAKHLRGESLTDVIFNGSNTRQPVGQASVELVFDNSENKLGGQYASYSEISVKRQIDREGISIYYLNGARCRRKDIQGLFLGTGLGPRSYAIIEQGMISRLIEAKPEELRTFIEEAAGISRYRERRRETENRIRHTRENLARLNDIREELDRQLDHLQRQARAAERYQSLKEEERRVRAELLVLQWREMNAVAAERAQRVRVRETAVEQGIAELRSIETALEHDRAALAAANGNFNRTQSRFYEVGAAISTLEQRLHAGEERIETLRQDAARAEESARDAARQLDDDRARMDALRQEAGTLEPQLEGSRSESGIAYTALEQAEQALQGWQIEWDALHAAAMESARQAETARNRIEYLEAELEDAAARRAALLRELEAGTGSALADTRARGAESLARLEADVARESARVESLQSAFRSARARGETAAAAVSTLRARLHELGNEIAALEAMQGGTAGTHGENIARWRRLAGLESSARLIDGLDVDPEWTQALETVLYGRLQDVASTAFAASIASLERLDGGRAGVFDATAAPPAPPPPGRPPRLLDRVRAPWSLARLLGGIYIADDVRAALDALARLAPGESIVTRSGLWLGDGWAVANRPGDRDGSLLVRERRLHGLRARRDQSLAELEREEATRQRAAAEADELEQSSITAQRQLGELQKRLADMRSADAALAARLDAAQQRHEALRDELADLDGSEERCRDELDAARQCLDRAVRDEQAVAAQRERLMALRDQHRGAVERARARWQSTHEHSHEIALRLEALSSRRASLEQAMERSARQLQDFREQHAALERALAATREPLPALRAELEHRLGERVTVERELAALRDAVQSVDGRLRDGERRRAEQERHVQGLRDELEAARMAAQETAVRLQTVLEQLQTAGHEPETLLPGLDEAATIPAWSERLDALARRIDRLGPINLAAIDEHRQLAERKEYLDRQHADLNEALETLETAIRKIDKESRTRFQETFDRLNANLKETFPVLFGGGHAYLELIGEDLLETGVSVMARPPGKRNSNIHLLSGGEKALTAVALVFSIFKLNPAPFCILDEVDAPLDDTNTGRFSQLVAEMSRDVQFIFITHNKITMEIAQQLMGVTMHEAGVSRLVSVDVDEAVRMAATA